MSTAVDISLEERLHDLQNFIREGLILEALQRFYDPQVTMEDNNEPPTVGLAANMAREQQFLESVKEWLGFEVRSEAVGRDVTMYEAVYDFITTDGRRVHLEQVDVAKWKSGKIVEQRFYYDPATTKDVRGE